MVIDLLVIGLFQIGMSLFSWLFSFFPQDYPTIIDDGVSFVNYYIGQAIGIINFYYPNGYFTAVVPFLLNFFSILVAMAILKKIISIIPILDIDFNDGNDH